VATYELDVLAVPGQILPIQFRIIDGYILAFPETVLGCNLCVVNLHISAVLEYILGIALQSVYIDVLGKHEWISSIVEFYVLQFQAIYLPECLISICDVYVLQIQILHFAEELRPIDGAVFHHHIITIPDGRTAFWGEVAVCDKGTVHMPPRVFAIKLGMVAFYVLAALDARFAVCNRNIF
jgi:hypothetical protein